MFNKKFLLTLVVILGLSFFYFTREEDSYTNHPSDGTSIVAFGDSLVEGVGSSSEGFVGVLEESLDISIVNLGISGNTTSDALKRVNAIGQYDPKVVILLLGGNDFLRRVPVEETRDNLDKIIRVIHQTGAIVLLLGVESPLFGVAHRTIFDALAEKHNVAYIPDILDDIYGNTDRMSDTLHPNTLGYQIMAERIEPVLKEILE